MFNRKYIFNPGPCSSYVRLTESSGIHKFKMKVLIDNFKVLIQFDGYYE